jgi:hypothetical protein
MSKKSKPGDGTFTKGTKGAALYGAHFTEGERGEASHLTSIKRAVGRIAKITRS